MLSKSFSDALRDKALLVIAALVLAALDFFSFLLGDKYHIRPAWVFTFWLSVGFVAVIGRSLRARFRQLRFVLFFTGWLLVHVLVMLAAMSLLTLPFWIPVDLTGVFCTSESERKFTLEGRWYADEKVQAGADRKLAAAN